MFVAGEDDLQRRRLGDPCALERKGNAVKRSRFLALAGGMATSLALILTPVGAQASGAGIDAQINELMVLNGEPFATDAQRAAFVDDLEASASSLGLSLEAFVQTSLIEMREEAADEATESPEVSAMAGCETRKSIGDAVRIGDIFYSSSSRFGYTYGHTGIYYRQEYTVEALGPDFKSDSYVASESSVCTPATKLRVIYSNTGETLSYTRRVAAANKAFEDYRGKAYDSNHVANTTTDSSKLDCSELVWRAYKYSTVANVELNGDGGFGVFPRDIRDDNNTDAYATVS